MIHYSVLIPERDGIEAVGRLLPNLCQVLSGLLLPYEIICIDDASGGPAHDGLQSLLSDFSPLRVLRFDRPRGTSAALTAGIAAARGDLIIALDAHAAMAGGTLEHLVSRLSRHDLAFAENERTLSAALWKPLAGALGRLTSRAEQPLAEGLFWAARREAVAGLTLTRGAFRVLPGLVARRGFRVCRVTLAEGLPPHGATFAPGLVERLTIGRLDRHFEPHLARELERGAPAIFEPPSVRSVARRRFVPWPAVTAAQEDRREPA